MRRKIHIPQGRPSTISTASFASGCNDLDLGLSQGRCLYLLSTHRNPAFTKTANFPPAFRQSIGTCSRSSCIFTLLIHITSLSPLASSPFQSSIGTMPSAGAGFSDSAKEYGFRGSDSSSDSSGGMASESQVSRPGNSMLKSEAEIHI